MDFINGLYEARMTHDANNMKKLSYTDCCERVYVSLLIIELLRQFTDTVKFVKNYAHKTRSYSEYKKFQHSNTDLHNFIYFVVSDDALSSLKDPTLAQKAKSERSFPLMAVNRYLTQIANDNNPTQLYQMFTSIESGLRITSSELKTIRKILLSQNSHVYTSSQIRAGITKLLYISRTLLRSSDLITVLERVAVIHDLELQMVPDNYSTASKPDQLSGTDLQIISGIVGSSNVFMAIKFIDMVQAGDTIPASVSKAFQPAIDMLTDIIGGGPSYITALKSLQRQAKRSKNS